MKKFLSFVTLLLVSAVALADSFVGCTTGSATDSGNLTVSMPGGTLVGHTAVVSASYPAGGGPQYVAPLDTTGWTQLTNAAAIDAVAHLDSKSSLWVQKFSSTPPSSITFTAVGGSSPRNMGVLMCVWADIDPTLYHLSAFTIDTSGTIDNINHPSTDVPTGGGTVIMIGNWDQAPIANRQYVGGSYTERAYMLPAGAFTKTMYLASRESVSAGATGPLAFTFDPTSAGRIVYTVSFARSDVVSSGGLLLRRRRD